MIRAAVGFSTSSDTAGAVREAVQQALGRLGQAADSFIVFFSSDHAAVASTLGSALCDATGSEQIFGCSAVGVMTNEVESEGSAALAVMAIASDALHCLPLLVPKLRERDTEAAQEIVKLGAVTGGKNAFLTLLPDTYNGQPQHLLQALQNRGEYTPVIGAGASEGGLARATSQLCGREVTSNAVAGGYFWGDFSLHVDITQGCQPISEPMTVTKGEGNLIAEIDGKPALEVFARYLKGPLAQDLRRALMYLFVGVPADAAANEVSPGNYLVRNIIGLDPQRNVIAISDAVRPGGRLIFVLRDGQRARDDLTQMLERQRQRLQGRTPAFGLYFNCCARGQSLYGIPDIDSAYIKQVLGDFPLIGMFGGYELAPLGRANHLFAYTGVLALVTEAQPLLQ